MLPSRYEQLAIDEIQRWKTPRAGWVDKTLSALGQPLARAGDTLMGSLPAGDILEKAISGLVQVCNDAAQSSVRPQVIFAQYRHAGHVNIHCHADISALPLEQIDKAVGWLAAKYKGLALAEGAGTGALGLAGLAVDIPAVIALNLRAIGEYATYYGFDIARQEERLFAFTLLTLVSAPSQEAKNFAMAQTIKIAQGAAKKQAWEQLEKQAFMKCIQHISNALGVRITKVKMAQVLPLAGAAIGAGYNAYFTAKVCDAAYYLYRERFLAGRLGAHIIQEIVQPALNYQYPLS